MPPPDTSLEIASIDTFHLRFEGSYWEDYKRDETASSTARFEFKEGWSTVYTTNVETALVRIQLADGTVGWGEANVPIGPEVMCLILENLIAEIAAGREFAGPQALWDFLYDAQRGRGYLAGYWLDALAALDIAAWDAVGRRAGIPVSALLGRNVRKEIPIYLSGIRKATLQERIDRANEWVDDGGRGIKVFLDGDLDGGLSELEALKSGAPGVERWMVDTLWTLSEENAPRAKAEFGELSVIFLECPLLPEDLEGPRRLWLRPGAPIALGEHFRTSYQVADWFASPPALDVFQPDIGRTGITGGLRQLDLAEEARIDTTPHMGNGISIFLAATFHFSAICRPTHLQELQAGFLEKGAGISDSGWHYADGALSVPDRPGLGVEINEDELQRYVVRR